MKQFVDIVSLWSNSNSIVKRSKKMKLSSLLENLEYTCCQGSTEQEVSSVVYDSRKAEKDSLFICIKGAVVDGHSLWKM